MEANPVIYLSSQRGCTQENWYRSHHVFNFNEYQSPHRMPFGNLMAFNDDTLKGDCKITFQISEPVEILLIPIVGSIEYCSALSNPEALDTEESALIFLKAGDVLEIKNPFKDDLVNFLHIWRRVNEVEILPARSKFDSAIDKNKFVALASSTSCKAAIGIFDGRVDSVFSVHGKSNGVFVFVLEGAFEVQNRLLESRDGLALPHVEEVELEALSNNAIILMIEVQVPRG